MNCDATLYPCHVKWHAILMENNALELALDRPFLESVAN